MLESVPMGILSLGTPSLVAMSSCEKRPRSITSGQGGEGKKGKRLFRVYEQSGVCSAQVEKWHFAGESGEVGSRDGRRLRRSRVYSGAHNQPLRQNPWQAEVSGSTTGRRQVHRI